MPDLDLAAYTARLQMLVPEDSTGSLFEAETLLDMAVEKLSMDRPRWVATDVTGDGGEDYDLSASAVCGGTTGWVDEYSAVKHVEYETQDDRADAPSYTLGDEDWRVERDPTNGQTLIFAGAEPAATETFRVTFTRKWQLTATTNTVPDHYATAVGHLAASYYFRRLAADARNTRDMSINAGLVDTAARSIGHADDATYHLEQYNDFFGLKSGEATAVAVKRFEARNHEGKPYIFRRPA